MGLTANIKTDDAKRVLCQACLLCRYPNQFECGAKFEWCAAHSGTRRIACMHTDQYVPCIPAASSPDTCTFKIAVLTLPDRLIVAT